MIWLGLAFFAVASLYSSVGFGGGSSYLALLVLFSVPYELVPILALISNIVVVSSNCVHHFKARNVPFDLLLWPSLASVPLAFIGGLVPLPQTVFLFILASSLTLAGLLLLWGRQVEEPLTPKSLSLVLGLLIGGAIGFVSGSIGIGGGIFLSPILLLLQAGRARAVAAAASFFILINSLSGLMGQLVKSPLSLSDLLPFFSLPLAVVLGSLVGNYLLYRLLPLKGVLLLNAGLVLFVALRLWIKLI